MFSFRLRYFRERWRRLGGRSIAIYGGGRHTEYLLDAVRDIDDGPIVVGILDDRAAPGAHLGGIPVHRPAAIDPAAVSTVLVSSDTREETLAALAQAWARTAPPDARPAVERLYEGLPPGPYQLHDAVIWT